MATTTASATDLCQAAKQASRILASLETGVKNDALERVAQGLIDRTDEIIEANALDVEAAGQAGLSPTLIDRLTLDPQRIAQIAAGVRQIAGLADPVGEVISGFRAPNGLDIRHIRVPLGVIAVVYEARPNVTIDAAALCLKSGNAIVLRGSSAAAHSNAVLVRLAVDAATAAGVPEGAISLLAGGGREELAELAGQSGLVDLIIPRGGGPQEGAPGGRSHPGHLRGVRQLPRLRRRDGRPRRGDGDHPQREGPEAERLQRRRDAPRPRRRGGRLPARRAGGASRPRASSSAGTQRTRGLAGTSPSAWPTKPTGRRNSSRRFLAVRVVESVDEAIDHIGVYGSGHSEAIVTRDTQAARRFQLDVDAACVYVNASTRFTDGGEFGMGAEIGNSTQKLHARGPIGMRELCTTKYLIEGDGHVRP